jgi:hypothetical protein
MDVRPVQVIITAQELEELHREPHYAYERGVLTGLALAVLAFIVAVNLAELAARW